MNKSYTHEDGTPFTKEEFLGKLKTDKEFNAKFGRKDEGINQIQNAIDALNNNPDSRRIIVSALNVGEIEQMALPPCHWAFELYTEELKIQERMDWLNKKNNTDERYRTSTLDEHNVPTRRLHMKFHMRSNDVFLGNPYNIASYALLLHMFAQQTNMVPGTLVGDLTNVHIYNNHMDYVIEQLGRDSNKYSTPTLKLKKAKDIFSYTYEDFEIIDYETYPNWKNVPIAI
jgi:thymidylate synthase